MIKVLFGIIEHQIISVIKTATHHSIYNLILGQTNNMFYIHSQKSTITEQKDAKMKC